MAYPAMSLRAAALVTLCCNVLGLLGFAALLVAFPLDVRPASAAPSAAPATEASGLELGTPAHRSARPQQADAVDTAAQDRLQRQARDAVLRDSDVVVVP